MVSDERTLQQLTDAFAQLGAAPAAAPVMAAQLLKRAQQVAREKGITEEAALADLLAKVAAGRRGDYQAP